MSSESAATILVVEDDPGVARLLQLRLERAGYQVQVAANAAEALGFVRGGVIDLMLLDQNLPGGVNGLDLYQQVKEAGFDLPAILVTGFSGEGIVLQSFRAGVYDFVPKTTDYLDYLLPTIDRVLKKRQTECQLVESEARLGSMIGSALDAVLTVDAQHRIGIFNPAAEQMFGLSCSQAQGQPAANLLPAWGDAGGPKPGAQIQRWETEGVRADGGRFPVELSVSWVEANRRRFWTCFARDISERRRAEAERERFIRLQEVDRSKDEFLAMLAHELRNPLAPIQNALELIRLESPVPAETQENWAIIDRQVTHLARLVDDLLDVSRIRQGKIVLQQELLDLSTVVTRALESSRPLIQARRHSLNVSLPSVPLPLRGDLVRLVQVLSNLLNNAAKYTPEGGRIDLIVERAGSGVKIRVRDTGMGIPPELMQHLYDPFTQSKRTLDRADGGLGVGLTLVRRLTEMHGGSVEGHSEGQGKGSEFVVRLPLLDQPAGRPAPQAAARAAASATPRRRILVVDDNQDSAKTLAKLLQVLGHDVRNTHDGASALEQAADFRPEILLLDIGLPGMDGYEVARRLRADERFAATVLIALTGYGSPEDRQQSFEAGFNAHLVKPVDLEALKHLLAQPLELLLRQSKPN